MKFMKSIMMGTGGVALAGLVLTLAAPKTAHALVAAAVQVVGIASVSAIDEPGRTPYQAVSGNLSCLGIGNCVYTFQPIPANHRLVLQQISGGLGSNLANPSAQVIVGSATRLNVAQFPVFGNYFTGPLVGYYDAGVAPTVQFIQSNGDTSNGFGQAFLTGHLLDCSVVSCAAMVIQ